MDNINELYERFNDLLPKEYIYSNFMQIMNNANTIEQLLILKWHFSKIYPFFFFKKKIEPFYKNVERITYTNAISNSNSIITDLINDQSLEQIKDRYNVTTEAIERIVINYLESDNYDERILDKIDLFKQQTIPEHDRGLIIAKKAIQMFIAKKCYVGYKVEKEFACSLKELSKYLKILESAKHPLFTQYMKLNREYISARISKHTDKEKSPEENNNILNLDSESILEILSNTSNRTFINFCLHYGFDTRFLLQILKDDKSLKYRLANEKENIPAIYNQYVNKYKEFIRTVIMEIIMLSKDNFRKPLDLYGYYTKTNINFKDLAKLAINFKDINKNKLILQYSEKFQSIFEEVDQRQIDCLKQSRIMSCIKDNIVFTVLRH